MPKAAAYALVWSPDHNRYELIERGADKRQPIDGAEADWFNWLEAHRSFSFHGRAGRLNLLKESRKSGGAGYWYAYRRQGPQIVKRYAGRSIELAAAHLEQIAAALNTSAPAPIHEHAATQTDVVPQNGTAARQDAAPTSALITSPHAPLLIPKLQPPRLHGELIRRDRLLAKLDAGLSRKLTLISAPAGFGRPR